MYHSNMKNRFLEVSIIIEDGGTGTLAEAMREAKRIVESFGLKAASVKPVMSKRSQNQNNALHLWLSLIEEEARAQGMTMDMIIKNPAELPITRHLLKDLFRFIGKKMYGKDSTTKLDKIEFGEVQRVFEKTIGERLEIYIPWPSIESLTEQNEN